eukprot:CAMPEP_0170449072 /NCGR_PEP_ID=MMETSP0117_2-20130122/51051_1 /TAXON_ID=400756 /ORGANISM="Durinskia baltica, Strain CSIRO CS-38" /LENGTH=841 /DNA_ID=CAMNT_0010710293 /DNA_START=62 /DNA_END=2590 /DNA_ORIENTATION=-
MSGADTATVAAAAKKRLRREARIRENYDRISATLSSNDSKATKNPTRIIPDAPGFQILTKAEIKRDTKDIEKNSTFAPSKERNVVEEMDALIQRSMRPHCAAESSLMKKKRRLVNWINNPETVDKEMQYWQNNLSKAQDGLATFESLREEWLTSFQSARRFLSDALRTSTEQNKRMKSDGLRLLSLCEAECGNSQRKKRSIQAKDLVDELLKRQDSYEVAVAEYISLAQSIQLSSGKATAPVVTLSVDEVHYAEDDVYIRNKHRTTASIANGTTASANATKGFNTIVSTKVEEEVSTPPSSEINTKSDSARVKNEGKPCVEYDVETAPMESFSEIPLPYFDHETKQVIHEDGVDKVPVADSTSPVVAETSEDTTAATAGSRTRRSGSGKLEASMPSATDLEAADSSDEPSTGDLMAVDDINAPTANASGGAGSWSPSAADAGRLFSDQDLVQLLVSLQESVRLSEGMVTDAEFMFQERPVPIDDASLLASVLSLRFGVSTCDGSSTTQIKSETTNKPTLKKVKSSRSRDLDVESANQLATKFMALSRADDREWSAYLDALFDALHSQGIVTRKGKKKGPENLPITVDPRLRTPRGVSLLLSPLSQFENRMIGTIPCDTIYQARHSNGEVTYTSTVNIPAHLRKAEDEALMRLHLQSTAARADLQLTRLRSSLKDMAKVHQEAQSALRRAESHHEVASLEEAMELRKMYKELIHYGIIQADPDAPPMSPITSNAPFITQNGGNNRPGAKNNRAPVRINSVTAAATAKAAVLQQQQQQLQQRADGVVDVTRMNSSASEGGTTTESLADSEEKATEEGLEAAESLKRKAVNASSTVVSAPKRRR